MFRWLQGVKVRLIVQLAPAGTLPTQLFVAPKSVAFAPATARLETIKDAELLFVSVIVCGAVGMPTGWLAKVRVLGDRRRRLKIFATKAARRPVLLDWKALTVGKLSVEVIPLTYALPEESTTMPVPPSVMPPPLPR